MNEQAPLTGEDYRDEDLALVAARLAAVRRRLAAAGADPAALSVVAVTKGLGLAAVRIALRLGLVTIGENYADELVAKAKRLAEVEAAATPSWHFLGALQQNKIGRLAHLVSRFEGVDRLAEGERIARLAPGARVLVEVDCTGRAERGGVVPAAVPELIRALSRLDLRVEGLMTIGVRDDAAASTAAFVQVARLADDLGLAERSMGMSGDFELAAAAGATTVRLGTALFGPRPPREGAARGDAGSLAAEMPE